ncbi:MAG: hypothetical protein N3C57_00375 [Aquificaceae bacterium]|nr:hypothetical protein [Aquificaceae bacterium]
MIKKIIGVLLIVLMLLSGAISCGGGGGGTGGGTGGGAPVQPANRTVNVSGSVLGLSSLVGSQVQKAQQPSGAVLKDAVVEVVAYNTQGAETGRFVTTTSEAGFFVGSITLSGSGGHVVITVKKQGFADYSRRIDFSSPSDINLRAELTSLITAVARRDNAVFSQSTGERVFKFALFEVNGQKVLKAGRDAEIAKQNGQEAILEIQIPTNSVPQNVNTLVAQLQTFQPSRDSERFPGQYRDDKGRTIVSLGFDYINIADDRGQNLGQLTSQAIRQGLINKAQTERTRISRRIDANSCRNILNDFCGNDGTAVTGVQGDNAECSELSQEERRGYNVPIYTYNPIRGLWEMLGIGTIDRNADDTINSSDIFSSNENVTNLCSNAGGFYVIIRVTNQDFIRNWWNLDYPLLVTQPTQLCLDVSFTSNNAPVQGVYVYVYDDDNSTSFGTAWGVSDSNGRVRLTTVLYNNQDSDRGAKIYYWTPEGVSEERNVTLGTSTNCGSSQVNIQRTICTVRGTLRDDTNAPLGGKFLYAYSGNYYAYAYTDNNGNYSMQVRCNEGYSLYYGGGGAAVFNVNGTREQFEESDGNGVAVVNLTIPNSPPYVYGWLSTTSIRTGQSVYVNLYAWDMECDKPLLWEVYQNNDRRDSGQEQNQCYLSVSRELTFSTAGSYNLKIVVTDAKNKRSEYNLGTLLVVTEQNRPPVISYAYPSSYTVARGALLCLYADAYDLDGDQLTYTWKRENQTICSTNQNQNCKQYCFNAPNEDTVLNLRLEVSDGRGGQAARGFEVYVGELSRIGLIIQGLKTTLFRRWEQ